MRQKIGVVVRIGPSTARVTLGTSYTLFTDSRVRLGRPHIYDKQGKPIFVSFPSRYWKELYSTRNEACDNDNTNTEKKVMLKIETVLMVGDRRADDLEVESVLQLIETEQGCIDRLSRIRSESEAIRRLSDKHKANVTSLLEILGNKVS